MTSDEAFVELRPAMFALAYRITGSRSDADDIVQDAFLRLHNSEPKDPVRSLKAYLATITARLSLNRLRDAKARRETYIGEWLPEPLFSHDSSVVRAEDISFALLVVLERLSPTERVVFVLRNAFELSFEEIAPIVERDTVSCRKIFSRAHQRIAAERPRFTVDRSRHRALLRGFLQATREQNIEAMAALLDDNVVLHGDGGGKAFANRRPVAGARAVAQFILAAMRNLPETVVIEEIEINGTPGLLARTDERIVFAICIETDGSRITAIFGVANPDKLEVAPRAV
jgi:RNA polymerase sigma-70 factor (ECF subfamily)